MLIQSKLFYLSSGPPPTHIVPLLKVQTQKQKQVYLINMRNQMCVCYIYFNFITAFSKLEVLLIFSHLFDRMFTLVIIPVTSEELVVLTLNVQ